MEVRQEVGRDIPRPDVPFLGVQTPRQVEIRTGAWPFVAMLLSTILVAGASGLAWMGSGRAGSQLAVAVAAATLAGILLAEWPQRVTFDVDGIERRSMLRKRRIPWGEVDSLERLPPRMVASLDALAADRAPRRRGLAARTVRGSLYILSTTTESPEVMAALQHAVTQWAPYCRMSLLR